MMALRFRYAVVYTSKSVGKGGVVRILSKYRTPKRNPVKNNDGTVQYVQLSHQVPIEIICSRTSRIKQIALTLQYKVVRNES